MLIRTRDLEFDVTVGGADAGPPVLLLHGFPQNATMWSGVSPALHAAGFRTIAPDQRGYSPGARPSAVEAYAQEECIADAVAFLDALGYERAHVVGHDWGAMVAWGLAANYPDRVNSLTAVSVPHPRALARALLTDRDQMKRSSYIMLFRKAGKAEDVLLDQDALRLRGLFSGVGLSLSQVNRYVVPLLAPGALTAALNWYRAYNLLQPIYVGAVDTPTTFVWSDGDIAISRTAAENCAAQVTADYRFVPVSGVGHFIPDEAPDVLADAIMDRITRPVPDRRQAPKG
jgi:pimeloyl-ACP methyl ester carboxylesterase